MPNQLTKKFGYFGVGDSSAAGLQANPSGAAGAVMRPRPGYHDSMGGFAPDFDPSTSAFARGGAHPNPMHRSNRPQGVPSGSWRDQVTSTLPGGSAAGGMFPGTGGVPGAGGVSTGIGSTITPQQVTQARMAMMRAAGVPMTPGQAGAVASNYGDVARGLLDADDTDLARWGAFQQHDLQSQMENARANAGAAWGNVGVRMNELDINDILGQGDLFGNKLALIQSLLG